MANRVRTTSVKRYELECVHPSLIIFSPQHRLIPSQHTYSCESETGFILLLRIMVHVSWTACAGPVNALELINYSSYKGLDLQMRN